MFLLAQRFSTVFELQITLVFFRGFLLFSEEFGCLLLCILCSCDIFYRKADILALCAGNGNQTHAAAQRR